MFLLAALLYVCSAMVVVALSDSALPLFLKLAVAPIAIYCWLIVGSDGNTSKAGQMKNSGEDPEWRARGVRHGLMLKWHELCDSVLGDIADSSR